MKVVSYNAIILCFVVTMTGCRRTLALRYRNIVVFFPKRAVINSQFFVDCKWKIARMVANRLAIDYD
jgi:hypothetical protein